MDAGENAEPQQHNHQRPQSLQRQQKPVKTGTWLQTEDARLREAVAQHGTRWVRVAGEVGTRNGDQCAKRWNENLKPDLDHSPWTAEEDERLLNMVKTYGHNWKYMADNVLESRAPLALKNRYSLLMRRFERQGNGKQQSANAGGAKPLQYAAPSLPSSGSATPLSSNSTVDLTNIFSGGSGPPSRHADYASMGAASSYFPPSTGPSGAGTGCGRAGGVSGTALWTPTTATSATTAWDDQDLIWQHQPFHGGGMELHIVSSGTANHRGENEMEKVTMMSDNGTSSRRLPSSEGGSGLGTPVLLDGWNNSMVPPADVEYSVTCQWGKLKTLTNHLVDAAMSESAEWAAEDEKVTMTLRLKV